MNFSEWNTQFEVLRLEVRENARRVRGRSVSVDPIEAHQNEQALKTARNFPTNPIVFYQMLQRRLLEEVYHRKRKDPDEVTLADAMSSPVRTCRLSDDVDTCLELLREHHIRHLAIVEEGALVGVLGLRDLLAVKLSK